MRPVFKLSKLLLCIISGICFSGTVRADLYFAPELIADNPGMVADLSHFENSGSQLPGGYPVDIYLNGKQLTSRTLRFVDANTRKGKGQTQPSSSENDIRDSTGLQACMTGQDLENMGVNLSLFPAISTAPSDQCISPGLYIPDAFTSFDFQKMRLDISIPQAAMKNDANGYIPPEKWDEGINAALLDYSFSGNTNSGSYGTSSGYYLTLKGGLNLGPWRLRDRRTWNEYQNRYSRYSQWQHLETYAERTIVPLRSELVAGDSTTSGDVFDSLGFRGVQMATDDAMSPDSMRGYAPVIKGVASTTARVSIRQNGYIVYHTFVSPGPFEIHDLYPVSSSGDLEVTVTEADGSSRVFTVPYSSVPVLQRDGNLKYALTAGHFHSSGSRYENPAFVQGTLVRGLPHNVTVYGGVQYSGRYLSGLMGAGLNMGTLGAFSVDVTQANSTLADGSQHQGQSLRFLYARSLNTLGTTFQLMGYRYSTRGFYTLDETALKGMEGWLYDTDTLDAQGRPVKRPYTDYYDLYDSRREKVQASISQRVGDLGSVYLSGIRQSYWNTSKKTTSLQAGFNGSVKSVSYSLSTSRQMTLNGADQSVFLTLSVPLDGLTGSDSHHNMSASYSVSEGGDGEVSHQAGLSGTALEDDRLNWSLSQSWAHDAGNGGNLSADYRGSYGDANAGYSYSRDYRQFSYGLSGGMVLHGNGLTLGQPLGETNVLVAVPGVPDVGLENGTGVRTDWHGYTIMPYATLYRENRVALDTDTLNDHTDIDNAVSRVVPTRGAIVRATFSGHTGSRMLMTLLGSDGKPLPFGTMVTADDRGGIVGDAGQVYLSGMGKAGTVKAAWGTGAGSACTVHYRLTDRQVEQDFVRLRGICKTSA
ncbi:Outer membrane usher protein fimD precursor [Serratia grimesii]|uniref:fimbria/pilus outer membrane usher protein n=1 Tax=Serratia grimesii TaxID=82995 RepID=UPI0021C4DFF8|nr:fimbria/pilus outer membrane usher protein [Serratia grimesii]CAI2793938.1 Outer membrane usher protein fimD precursor [Serratia grimesii]